MTPQPISFHGGDGNGHDSDANGLPGWGRIAIFVLAAAHVLAFLYWLILLWRARGQTLMSRTPSRDSMKPRNELSRFELKIPQRFIQLPGKQK